MAKYYIIRYISVIIINCIIISFASCSRQTSTKKPKTLIVLNDKGNLLCSDNFKKIEFIPIETNDQNYFRNIKDIKVVAKHLFIFSAAPDNMVSIYNTKGKFINTIRNVGNGPGEINYAVFFDVDTCIRILDIVNKKVTNFMWDGKLMNEYRMDQRIDQFSMLEGNRMVSFNILSYYFDKNSNLNPNNTSKLIINDIVDNRLIPKKITIDLNKHKFIPILLNRNYSITSDTLYYWDLFNDTIMSLTTNENYCNNVFQIIDFGKRKMPKNIYAQNFNKKNTDYDKIIDRGYPTIHDFFRFKNGKECFIIYHLPNLAIGIRERCSDKVDCYGSICFNIIHDKLIKEISFMNFKFIKYDGSSNLYFSWDSSDFLKSFDMLEKQLEKSEWELILDSNQTLQNALLNIKKGDNPVIVKLVLN